LLNGPNLGDWSRILQGEDREDPEQRAPFCHPPLNRRRWSQAYVRPPYPVNVFDNLNCFHFFISCVNLPLTSSNRLE
jgi:hypothetical protein